MDLIQIPGTAGFCARSVLPFGPSGCGVLAVPGRAGGGNDGLSDVVAKTWMELRNADSQEPMLRHRFDGTIHGARADRSSFTPDIRPGPDKTGDSRSKGPFLLGFVNRVMAEQGLNRS